MNGRRFLPIVLPPAKSSSGVATVRPTTHDDDSPLSMPFMLRRHTAIYKFFNYTVLLTFLFSFGRSRQMPSNVLCRNCHHFRITPLNAPVTRWCRQQEIIIRIIIITIDSRLSYSNEWKLCVGVEDARILAPKNHTSAPAGLQ